MSIYTEQSILHIVVNINIYGGKLKMSLMPPLCISLYRNLHFFSVLPAWNEWQEEANSDNVVTNGKDAVVEFQIRRILGNPIESLMELYRKCHQHIVTNKIFKSPTKHVSSCLKRNTSLLVSCFSKENPKNDIDIYDTYNITYAGILIIQHGLWINHIYLSNISNL